MAEEEVYEGYGIHFGKLDLDRVGFFDDPPPGPFDEYVHVPLGGGLREGLAKGRQILCRHRGELFENEFKRIFTGEALPELGRPVGKKSRKKSKYPPAMVGPKLNPPGGSKLHSSPGDWYGCIGKQPKHFSPETIEPVKVRKEGEKEPPNFVTKPNPLGGPGYLNICFNPYVPRYVKYEPYDLEVEKPEKEDKQPRRFVSTCLPRKYFDDNPYRPVKLRNTPSPSSKRSKKPLQNTRISPSLFYLSFPKAPLGENSGCFSRFPKHMSDPYKPEPKKKKRQQRYKTWWPAGCPETRTKYTVSIIERVTTISCNRVNYTEYREQVYRL